MWRFVDVFCRFPWHGLRAPSRCYVGGGVRALAPTGVSIGEKRRERERHANAWSSCSVGLLAWLKWTCLSTTSSILKLNDSLSQVFTKATWDYFTL